MKKPPGKKGAAKRPVVRNPTNRRAKPRGLSGGTAASAKSSATYSLVSDARALGGAVADVNKQRKRLSDGLTVFEVSNPVTTPEVDKAVDDFKVALELLDEGLKLGRGAVKASDELFAALEFADAKFQQLLGVAGEGLELYYQQDDDGGDDISTAMASAPAADASALLAALLADDDVDGSADYNPDGPEFEPLPDEIEDTR